MTPGARLQSAVELTAAIEDAVSTAGPPADRIVKRFFAGRRFAGSKDRAAISELAYAALRRRAELLWRFEMAGIDSADRSLRSRMMVFAISCIGGGETPDRLAQLCDGSQYAPAPLDKDERAALAAAAGVSMADAPNWVLGNFPRWLEAGLVERFGDRLVVEMSGLNGRAPVDLRANLLKGDRSKALTALAREDFDAKPTPFSPVGIRLEGRGTVSAGKTFRRGLVEIQDEGSQIAALLVEAAPGMQVLDLCAGSGGKTLALAAAMTRKGQIFACDVDKRRLARLRPRLKRAGAHNVQLHELASETDPWLNQFEEVFDRVLVDAPCSGTGTWRRNPDGRWRLTPEMLENYRQTQGRLLAVAAPLVKPGGRLIYVTCSLLKSENEVQVDSFLRENPDFLGVDVAEIWQNVLEGACPERETSHAFTVALSPESLGVDGFFAAVMQRR